jgi:rod shape-determining protein MreC
MRKNQQNLRKIIIFLIIIIFIFVLNLTLFPENIKSFFFSVSWPVQKTLWQANVNLSNFTKNVFKTNDVIKQAADLELKNQELISQIISLKELRKENEFLRQALEIDLAEDFQLILAQVISQDVFQDSILINKGRKHGLSENLPVITNEKVVLGRIGQVYDNFSEVVLITNKKSSFDVKIVDQDIYGIARGKGNSNIFFELIPKDQEIFENDIVVSSVLGGIYPADLFVGQIKTVTKSDLEPFQEAELIPGFNLKSLDYLFIIKEF